MNKKRFVALLLAAVLAVSLLGISAFAAEADVQMSAGNVEAVTNAGTTVAVPVSVDVNNGGFVVGRVDIKWDKTALELISITYGTDLGQNNGSPKEGLEVDGKPTDGIINDGEYPVSFGDYTPNDEDPGENWNTTGTVFTLNFKVCEGANVGDYEIGLSGKQDDFLDNDVNEKTVSFTAGKVTLYNEITAATLSITPPEKGATPATSATATSTGFTCGTVTWEGNPAVFSADTAYKATVTLTAEPGYKFADSITAIIGGANAIIESKTTSVVTVSYTFPKTDAKSNQTITCADITATYGDGAQTLSATTSGDGVISYAIASGDDVIAIEDGKVSFLKAGSATIKVTAAETENYEAAEKTITVTVSAADYSYVMNANNQYIKIGSDLSKINVAPEAGVGIGGAEVSGTLKWYTDEARTEEATADAFVTKGTITLYWSFTATDANYVATAKTGSVTFATVANGDVNGDGKVSAKDAMILYRYLAHWSGYEDMIVCMDAANINGEGTVDGADAMYLARHLAGWSDYLVI